MKNFRDKLYKKFSATQIFVLSFCIIILLGSILLSLPICNDLKPAPYLDNLFTATSATCVTGLVTLTTATQFNMLGQFIIMCLIQVGGLGLMTFIAIFLISINRKLKYQEKLALQGYLNKDDLSNFNHYLIMIYKYTFIIELAGALLLMIRFIPEYGYPRGIFNSIFLSISAFCNAGFDTIGSTSLVIYATDYYINIIIMVLIILGGLGFIVWFEITNLYKTHKSLSLHTRIVLITTLLLIISGTVFFFIFEYDHTLANYSLFDKLFISLFQSITYRTAGFASIDFAASSRVTKLIACFYMFIGGSSGGCAGGIKTTTIVLIIMSIKTLIVNGGKHFHIFKKQIANDLIYRSYVIFSLYLAVIMIDSIILFASETIETMPLLFEIFSALGTVGLTCSVTTSLSIVGKIVIIFTMLIGRVGPISILLVFSKQNGKDIMYRYPNERVLIG